VMDDPAARLAARELSAARLRSEGATVLAPTPSF
jgi:hypothetical protein